MADNDVTDYNAQIAKSSSDVYRIKALAEAADSLLWNGRPDTPAAEISDSVGRILELVISESTRVADLLVNFPQVELRTRGAA